MNPLIAIAIGSLITISGFFVNAYLGQRSELDKKMIEAHYKLIEEMISTVLADVPSVSVNIRVKAEFPDYSFRWASYWRKRELSRDRVALEDDRSTQRLIMGLREAGRQPRPGMLMETISFTGLIVFAFVIFEIMRIGGVAYPDVARNFGMEKAEKAVYFVDPFPVEVSLAKFVRKLDIPQYF
jgi:hypothetical protein